MPWSTQSRHARGYGSAWDKLRIVVRNRDDGLCQPCLRKGRVTAFAEVDHIKPKSLGGSDELDNLQCICAQCHLDKTIKDNGGQRRPMIGADGWPVE